MRSNTMMRITSNFCLALIAAACILYLLFGSDFAEINIQLPFLRFPIFIGEILMIFCVSVFIVQALIEPVGWRSQGAWRCWYLGFLAWLVFKAGEGYLCGGAYALRNAALFYYSVFGVLVEHFLGKSRGEFDQRLMFVASVVLAVLMVVYFNQMYAPYAWGVAVLCLALCLLSRWIRWLLIGFIVCFFFSKFQSLSSGRALFIGILSGMSYLAYYALKMFRFSIWKIVISGLALIAFLFAGAWMFGDRNSMKSLAS
ncbi:MAG: hypothetical protein HQL22_07970, partial [Candidatus Omnitrophica bacterium]|nr:hypothetical protein [Candidatus Omnitrophota bacterium]